jgi:hypothetical protein
VGRALSRQIYLATSTAKKLYHYIRVTGGMYQDLLVWNLFLDKFNGVSYMLDIDWSSSSVLESFTDSAAGSTKGCGSYILILKKIHVVFSLIFFPVSYQKTQIVKFCCWTFRFFLSNWYP